MNGFLSALLCFISIIAVGQAPAYQANEVDSTAIPRGGVDYLNLFLQANLRKPVQAQAEGVGGRVILAGIVEPDGRITEAKVLRSLRPDIDREVLRIFQAFNAWQPARKDGAAVRQAVVFPYLIAKNAPFIYTSGRRIDYFGADEKAITDTAAAQFRQEKSVDSLGTPNGDLVLFKRKRKGWAEERRIPLVREKRNVGPHHDNRIELSDRVEQVGYKDGANHWIDDVYEFSINGSLLAILHYVNGQYSNRPVVYHNNGVVAELETKNNEQTIVTSWYRNGQIWQVKSIEKPTPESMLAQIDPARVLSVWAPDGKQLVKDGRGNVSLESTNQSYTSLDHQTRLVEMGSYLDGRRQGVWTGHNSDGSFNYEEVYDRGVLQSGKANRATGSSATYTIVEQQPEFPGGMRGLGQFLAENLRYPPDAQRNSQQGQVMLSFVVCTDGTLCDYEIVKGVSPSVDEEALRVVKRMSGKWKPGSQRGEPVRVKFTMPINFTLQ